MAIESTPILLALILSIVHLYSARLSVFVERHHIKIVSLSAGILIALIFLYLLPEVVVGASTINVYAFILLGFAIFHVAEKYLYQHIRDKKELIHELAELRIIGFFIDHFILGIVLVLTNQLMKGLGLLIFIPFLLHVSSSISLEHIHSKSKTHFNKIVLAFSTLIGALVASSSDLSGGLYYGLFAFTIGLLLYIVIRDMLPKKDKGDPISFLIGIILILITNFIALYL